MNACVICGELASVTRGGCAVCDFHRSMIDGGHTLDELRAERDALATVLAAEEPRPEDADTEELLAVADDEVDHELIKADILEAIERGAQSRHPLLDERDALINEQEALHALLETAGYSIDEDLLTCVGNLLADMQYAKATLRQLLKIDDYAKAFSDTALADFTETLAYVGRRPMMDVLADARKLTSAPAAERLDYYDGAS